MSSASGVGSSYYYASGSAAAASVYYPPDFERSVGDLCDTFNEGLTGRGAYATPDVPVRKLLKGVYNLCSQKGIKCNKDFQGWLKNLLQRKVMDSVKHTNTINVVTELLGLNPNITINAYYDSSWNKWTRGKENLLLDELVSFQLSSMRGAPVQGIKEILELQSGRFTDDKTPSDEDLTRLATGASNELLGREIGPRVLQPLANATAERPGSKEFVEEIVTALRRAREMQVTGEQFARHLAGYKLESLESVCSHLLALDIGGYYSHVYDLDSKTWKTGNVHKDLFEDLCKYALAPPFQCNLPFNFDNKADNEWFRKLSQGERFSLSNGGASGAAAAAASNDLAQFELAMKALRFKFHRDLKNSWLHVKLEELLTDVYKLCSKTGVKCNKDFQDWFRGFLEEGAEDAQDQRTLRGVEIAFALVGFNPSIQGMVSYDSKDNRWFPTLNNGTLPLLKELIKNQVFLPSDPSLQKAWVHELLALQETRFTDQPPTDDQFTPILRSAYELAKGEYGKYVESLRAARAEKAAADAATSVDEFTAVSSFDRPRVDSTKPSALAASSAAAAVSISGWGPSLWDAQPSPVAAAAGASAGAPAFAMESRPSLAAGWGEPQPSAAAAGAQALGFGDSQFYWGEQPNAAAAAGASVRAPAFAMEFSPKVAARWEEAQPSPVAAAGVAAAPALYADVADPAGARESVEGVPGTQRAAPPRFASVHPRLYASSSARSMEPPLPPRIPGVAEKDAPLDAFEGVDAPAFAPGGPGIAPAPDLGAVAAPHVVKKADLPQQRNVDQAPVQRGLVSRFLGSLGRFFSSILLLFSWFWR